uniref:Uncharacterized protein n=1 Tax=Osmundaria fimbriata TaxID=228265 RepID=A0A1Z1M4H4_OSMFI|nr:hypothetical protein [Osmundaria fimbriata]ARW60810.1 hypothetical protein [Osmundaria fimbriata]
MSYNNNNKYIILILFTKVRYASHINFLFSLLDLNMFKANIYLN